MAKIQFDLDINNFNLDLLESAIEKGVAKATLLVHASAVEKAPFDSGQLRNSIDFESGKEGKMFIGRIITSLEYAIYIEFGTGVFAEGGNGRTNGWVYFDEKRGSFFFTTGQEPQPFLRPALNNNAQKVRDIIANSIRNVTK
jgi:HK97 gp10 family phage protein